jgi:DDE superfamily endonuclease
MVLWDRRSMHQGQAITAIRQAYPRRHLEEVPAYVPALNPTEPVWKDCKGHTSKSLLRDLGDLRRRLSAKTSRVQRAQAKLHAVIRASKLPSPPS